MLRHVLCAASASLLLALCFATAPAYPQPKQPPQTDPLPAWNAGPAKRAIIEFVRATTDRASPKYVSPEQRIATFDNDGTLWVEQPLYPQAMFVLDRVKALAPRHPDWQSREPFKAVLAGDHAAVAQFTKKDWEQLLAVTHTGMSVDQFQTIARDWLATAKHPRFKRPYTECVYEPMLEVMRYLRAHGFKTYIVTGGGQAFVRVFSERAYGIPPEQVIGSAVKLKYAYQGGRPVMLRLPAVLLLDDEEGKPEDIELFIGRKPLAAFGNSDGDRQMLEWTQSGGGTRLMMLVHHDDARREYAYGAESKIGKFSDSLMAEAKKQGWGVVSMKNDWSRLFPSEVGAAGPLPRELVGKWVLEGGAQDSDTFDFFHHGSMRGRMILGGKEVFIDARVRIEGKTLVFTTRNGETGETLTRSQRILTLNATTLVLEDEQGQKMRMKRAD